MPAQSNLEQLKNAGCIPADAQLSAAEQQVIEGLSQREVKTLIDIRQKLADTSQQLSAESLTTDGSDDSLDDTLTPNIIV